MVLVSVTVTFVVATVSVVLVVLVVSVVSAVLTVPVAAAVLVILVVSAAVMVSVVLVGFSSSSFSKVPKSCTQHTFLSLPTANAAPMRLNCGPSMYARFPGAAIS